MTPTDEELAAFCLWYQVHFHRKQSFSSVVTTALCGHFRTYSKRAEELLKRCRKLGLVRKKDDIVYFQ